MFRALARTPRLPPVEWAGAVPLDEARFGSILSTPPSRGLTDLNSLCAPGSGPPRTVFVRGVDVWILRPGILPVAQDTDTSVERRVCAESQVRFLPSSRQGLRSSVTPRPTFPRQ